jgi:hypothetical protein
MNNSIGGNVQTAIKISRIIRKNKLSTWIPKDKYCSSACLYVFVGGICRMGQGKIGIHRGFSPYSFQRTRSFEEVRKSTDSSFNDDIVFFDEMNTRIKEGGLEKDINALLTGQHPTDSSIKPEAGFMIIASVNQATHAGRSNFSSAIEHRCNMISAKPLSEYQKGDFEKIITNWIENDKDSSLPKVDAVTTRKRIQEIAKSLQELLNKDPKACNLRDLKKALPDIFTSLGIESPQPNDITTRATKEFTLDSDSTRASFGATRDDSPSSAPNSPSATPVLEIQLSRASSSQ